MRRTLACLVLAYRMGGASAVAQIQTQNEDVQQLQDKVKQLEQLTEELKARLATPEKSQPGTPQVVNTKIAQPPAPQNASPPKTAPDSNPTVTSGPEVVVASQPANGAPAQGLPSRFDHGFQMQGSAMLIPKSLQLYAGGSTVFGEFGNPYDTRIGLNWFPWKNKVVRLNNEFLYLYRSPVGYTSVPFTVGAKGLVFHSNLEMAF